MAEATVLATIRQEIDKAVKKRERYKNLVNGKKQILELLKENINDCKRKVSATSFENKSLYADKLSATVEKIDKILADAAPLINRFNRDTINLGVAGATQAGKSTFLEAVSGVKLPRAQGEHSGDSTTAAKSIIINTPERKTTVFFRTKDEFITNIKAYLPENQRSRVSDIDDFENLPLDEIMAATINSRERAEIKRLQEAQRSFKYIKTLLGRTQEIDISDLADYVTYYQCKDEQHRFWPVVKLVEIRCPFDALGNSDIKLTLVDLPGMGESPRVSEQMVKELDHEVDTVLLLFRTNAVKPDDDAITFDAIKNAQKFVKDKTKFLSFLINVVENDDNRDGNINSIRIRINDIFKRNISENYITYETSVLNIDKSHNCAKVHDDVVNVLTKLVGDIDDLDSDTIDGWMATLNEPIAELRKQVSDIANQIKDDLPITADEDDFLDDKAIDLKKAFGKYNDLEDEYDCYQPIIEEFINNDGVEDKKVTGYKLSKRVSDITSTIIQEVTKIYDRIENDPLHNDDWDKEYTDDYYNTLGAEGKLREELSRLWTYVRSEYNEIENVAEVVFTQLKNDIIEKFNQLVNSVQSNCNDDFIANSGDEGIRELLERIGDKNKPMSMITESFSSLLKEKICFSQIVYPYIEEEKLSKVLKAKDKVASILLKNTEAMTKEEVRDYYKKRLTQDVRSVNSAMQEIIVSKTPFAIAAFLYQKVGYFNDCLNRSTFNEKEKTRCFKNFCKAFSLELWPEQFGDSSEIVVVRELGNNLSDITKLIEQINKIVK